jgi:uncharacterized protein
VTPAPRFVADAMLGSLARKLRIFGFDTSYFRTGEDYALLAMARREKRTILTSDTALFQRTRRIGLRACLVQGRSDRDRLLSLQRQATAMAFRTGRGSQSRCALCNGELELLRRRDAAKVPIPARALARHRLFYRCTVCSRLYWHGRHWERLIRLSYSLGSRDSAPGAVRRSCSRRGR